MNTFTIAFQEIKHRKWSFLLTLFAVSMGVAFFIGFFTMTKASHKETIRLTRDMGFNLRIVPGDTDINRFWLNGFSDSSMPEKYIEEFLKYKNLSFAHVTATLQKKIQIMGKDLILTGISDEIEPSGIKKSPMIFSLESGVIYVGHEIGKIFNLKVGGEFSINNKTFQIARILSETGRSDDIRIFGSLNDVQQLVSMPGQINEIKALQCLCISDDSINTLDLVRQQLNQVLPDTKIIMDSVIAKAREDQRNMIRKYFSFFTPVALFVIAIWIFVFTMMNVRERETELGILHSLGYNKVNIIVIFLIRSFFIGMFAAIIGFLVGTKISMIKGPEIFKVTADAIKPIYSLLVGAIVITPIFSAVSSLIPVIYGVFDEPADIISRRR